MVTLENSTIHTIQVNILNREFQFKCEKEEVEQLNYAAKYLNDCVQIIKQSGKVVDYDRMIVMAALNICHDALQAQQKYAIDLDNLNKRMQNLVNQINGELD